MKYGFDAVTLKLVAERMKELKKKQDYLDIFNKLKPGSVVKLNVHPKFDLAISEIYLLKTIPYKKTANTLKYVVAVNLKTGAAWEDAHIVGCEFEIIKEV